LRFLQLKLRQASVYIGGGAASDFAPVVDARSGLERVGQRGVNDGAGEGGGVDGAVDGKWSEEQRGEGAGEGGRDAFGEAAFVTGAEEEAGAEDIERSETELSEAGFEIGFHAKVKVGGSRLRAHGGDQDAASGASGQGGAGVGEGKVVVDLAEVRLGASLLNRAAEATDEGGAGGGGKGRGIGREWERFEFHVIEIKWPARGGKEAGATGAVQKKPGGEPAGHAGGS